MGAGRLRRETNAFRGPGTERVTALDPIFNTDGGRAILLLDELRRTCPGARLPLQCRFEMADDTFLDTAGRVYAVLEFGL